MGKPPRLADVQCIRLRFGPGDRLIVRLRQKLDPDEKKRLLKTVQKFTGTDVEVLLVDLTVFDVEVDKKCRQTSLIY